MTNFQLVRQFHQAFGHAVAKHLRIPTKDSMALRVKLIEEELAELKVCMRQKDIIGMADAYSDLLYVVYGGGLEMGADLDACFAEVHRSNMTKLGEDGQPIYREDGKILKGPNYQPPDLKRVLGM